MARFFTRVSRPGGTEMCWKMETSQFFPVLHSRLLSESHKWLLLISRTSHTCFFPLFRMVQAVFHLNEFVAFYGPKTSHFRHLILLEMAYFQNLQKNSWTKKFGTTRNRFLGHFCTRKTFDQICSRVRTHKVCENRSKRGRFSENVFSLALRVSGRHSNEKYVTRRTLLRSFECYK